MSARLKWLLGAVVMLALVGCNRQETPASGGSESETATNIFSGTNLIGNGMPTNYLLNQ